jgi:hypothetical protein
VIADLDTLLTALYVELTDRIIPSGSLARSGPGKPPEVTDAELVCLAVAQVLLRYDDERHWLRAAASRVGHLFPRLLAQSEYNQRLKNAARLMEAALRWLADQAPGSAEMLRLMDATPVPCGQSVITARRSDLYGWAGYGYCPSHSRWYWGSKLLLIVTCDGTVTGFALANPKLVGEREQARTMLERQPANRPAPGTAIVTDKGLSGEDTEAFFARPDLGLTLIRPARKDEKAPRYFPNWLRQRAEAIIWTLKNQLGLERHGGPRPRRAVGPRHPAAARAQRRHLVQLADRRPCQALPHQLRPLSCPHFPVNDLGPADAKKRPQDVDPCSSPHTCRDGHARPACPLALDSMAEPVHGPSLDVTEAVGTFFAHFDVYANVEEALADFGAVHALAHRARADRRVRRRGSGAQG